MKSCRRRPRLKTPPHGLAEVLGEATKGRTRKQRQLLVEVRVFFAETVDASGSIQKTLLAGEKGMAGRADFHMFLSSL